MKVWGLLNTNPNIKHPAYFTAKYFQTILTVKKIDTSQKITKKMIDTIVNKFETYEGGVITKGMDDKFLLKGLEEWKDIILKSNPDAYREMPNYMAMLDRDIAEAKLIESVEQ